MPLDDTNWPTIEVDETTALLIRARGFIERGWCRHADAKDRFGWSIEPTSDRAVEWCAYGALRAAGWSNGDRDHPALHRLQAAINSRRIAAFNNRQETVEPILAAFDRAITAGG
jgi:hypothetical protein